MMHFVSLLICIMALIKADFTTKFEDKAMMKVLPEVGHLFRTAPIFTVGEDLPSSTASDNIYTPPGILDGMGAFRINQFTARLFTNHELYPFQAYPYELCKNLECSETFEITGARVSFYDFDVETLKIKDAGVAYKFLFGADGELLTDSSTLRQGGLIRFCSAQLVAAFEYGFQRGIEDSIYFAPEEEGSDDDPVGGAIWALDVFTQKMYKASVLGRGAWESVTQLDTGSKETIALIVADDTDPYDFDGDGQAEASPMYLYVGKKDRLSDDFLARNGLREGKTFVWVPSISTLNSPETFRGTGNVLSGKFVELNTERRKDLADFDGINGFDLDGFPTQKNLWLQARDLGAFKFSRPEDIATFSRSPNEFVMASTGTNLFKGSADLFGTLYKMKVLFDQDSNPLPSVLEVLRDGGSDRERKLRSPDNVDVDDSARGFVYVNEDMAVDPYADDDEEDLFGERAVNKNEAQIVRIDPNGAKNNALQISQMDRKMVIDPTISNPFAAIDQAADEPGTWESTGILDVSIAFGKEPGTLLVFNVQADGIHDQPGNSRFQENDLVEGGQLLFLHVEQEALVLSSAVTRSMEKIVIPIILGCLAPLFL